MKWGTCSRSVRARAGCAQPTLLHRREAAVRGGLGRQLDAHVVNEHGVLSHRSSHIRAPGQRLLEGAAGGTAGSTVPPSLESGPASAHSAAPPTSWDGPASALGRRFPAAHARRGARRTPWTSPTAHRRQAVHAAPRLVGLGGPRIHAEQRSGASTRQLSSDGFARGCAHSTQTFTPISRSLSSPEAGTCRECQFGNACLRRRNGLG